MKAAEKLLDLLRSLLSSEAWERFAPALAAAEAAGQDDVGAKGAFFAAYSAVARKLGKAKVVLPEPSTAGLREAGVTVSLAAWGIDELARAAMLAAAAARLPADRAEALVSECFFRGDNRERQAVLRVLPWLPEPARYLPLAVESCRTNVLTVFEAIACDNVYPLRHFPDANFHQLVLKALFMGAPLARVIGLDQRVTPELLRMAEDYAAERRAAGRPIPDDLTLLLSLSPLPPRSS